MSYGSDYEYPYVDFAELADMVEDTGSLPYSPPVVPVIDEEELGALLDATFSNLPGVSGILFCCNGEGCHDCQCPGCIICTEDY